jgi:hypothetical protein
MQPENLHLKARDILWFLECHPAMGGSVFGGLSLLQLQIEKVDERGRIEPFKGLEDVYWTSENYKKFKKEFDKEFQECPPSKLNPKRLISIQVPYEKVWGKKWSFDHIEYWGELNITAFTGKDFETFHDVKNWQILSGIETSGRSFEDLIVKIGSEFKEIYGDFTGQDFLTPKEKKNNKDKKLFLFKKATKNTNPEYLHTSTMVRNPKYIHIEAGELNRRWWRWFSKTPYCKKKWGNTTKKIISGKEFL